ncbi:MAG: hypothetical protein OES32_00145 [Acidobacteriota bacterium]|nr:hypothetical protein [Acidobacteriota bacterium]MDH3521968.1 hypothetical protein [Acidobacteriota bacterium]
MTTILRGAREDEGAGRAAGWRFALLWVAPVMLLLVAIALPLISGARTLYLRDVLNTHYEMKWAQAQAMRAGELPLVDMYRGGGQAHLANPNTVPLYPDNVLFLFAETLWAMNAHFWLHWLVAPFAGFWLGRALGMRREAAWAVGVVYVTSGYYLATLNLYNLVAPVTLAPALAAASVRLAEPARRRRGFVAVAVLWALMILGGDPMTAAVSLAAAAALVLLRHGRRYPWWSAAGAVAIGTGLSAPQWVEFVRMLSFTYRGFWGFGVDLATVGGWRPIDALELLVPFFFGRPDMNYWGQAHHANQVPLFFTLYPGVLVLALMAAARADGRRTLAWAWGLVAVSLFLALGEVNPIVVALSKLPGASLLRIPAKLWSATALGSAVLCGLAFGRLFEAAGRRRLLLPLGLLGGLYFVAWGVMSLFPQAVDAWSRGFVPETFKDAFVSAERLRWAGSCFLSLLLIALYLLTLRAGRRRPRLAALCLLVAHAASQLFLLRPAFATDVRAAYLEVQELRAWVPPGSRVVHGGNMQLFGPVSIKVSLYPDARLLWRERQMHADLHPAFGVQAGLRYELNLSPEGLDSFLTRAVVHLMPGYEDERRMRLLQIFGIEYLLLERELDPAALAYAELVHRRPTVGGELHVYKVVDPTPHVQVVGRVRGSENLNVALTSLLSPGFDHRSAVVLAGAHEPLEGRRGTARLIRETDESLEIAVSAPDEGVLVVQRTHLPIYRATIDGEPAALYAANLYRMGVKLPAGEHTVRIAVDRRPWHAALGLALLAAVALAWLGFRDWPRQREPRPAAARSAC